MRAPRSLSRLAGLLVLSMCGAACDVNKAMTESLEGWNLVIVNIAQVDSSGITGLGYGSYDDGEARASVSVSISPVVIGQQYAGHVHQGTCAAVGNTLQTLPVAMGRAGAQGAAPNAVTEFEIPVAYVAPDFVIDFHTTIGGVNRRVACGPMK